MVYNIFTTFIILLQVITILPAQNKKNKIKTSWQKIAELPSDSLGKPSLGVAGPVTGIVGDILMIAGGANFPENPPWKGGKKKYYDDIYLLKKDKGQQYRWMASANYKLKVSMAYAANVKYKKGFISIGGENEFGPLKSVFWFNWVNDHLIVDELPELPIPLTSCNAVCLGDNIYITGGNTGTATSSSLFVMDLSSKHKHWKELSKMPQPLENSVAAICHDGVSNKLIFIGGRYKLASDNTTTFSNKILKYCTHTDKWTSLDFVSNDGKPIQLAAGTGVAISKSKILLFGGDSNSTFNKIETINFKLLKAEKQDFDVLLNEKLNILTSHQGFDRGIYIYQSKNNTCTKIDSVPGLTQVTTTAIKWNDEIIIPSGEIKPGKRTAAINSIKVFK